MKEENPFNPIPLPENLALGLPPSTEDINTQQHRAEEPSRKAPKRQAGQKTKRPNRPRKTLAVDPPLDDQTRWQRVKGKVLARLATVDKERLKQVLIACGIAAGVVVAIIMVIKLLPVGLALLGMLGLAVLLRIWDRLGGSFGSC